MVYSSLLYIYGFLPLSLLIFYAVPKKHREAVLLVLSMLYCAAYSLYYLIFMQYMFTCSTYNVQDNRISEKKEEHCRGSTGFDCHTDITVLYSVPCALYELVCRDDTCSRGILPLSVSHCYAVGGRYADGCLQGQREGGKRILSGSLCTSCFSRALYWSRYAVQDFPQGYGTSADRCRSG